MVRQERLDISADTAARWLDQGILAGYRSPTGHRRIDPASVESMAKRTGMPRGASLTPAEWLRREVESGRLAAVPTDELLAIIADAIRARPATSPT